MITVSATNALTVFVSQEHEMAERLRVATSDGKYTIIQEVGGGMRFLRHGEPWPAADEQFAHVGMILALAQEIDDLRERIKLLEAKALKR